MSDFVPLTPEELADFAAEHREVKSRRYGSAEPYHDTCSECELAWPCPTARLAAEVRKHRAVRYEQFSEMRHCGEAYVICSCGAEWWLDYEPSKCECPGDDGKGTIEFRKREKQ